MTETMDDRTAATHPGGFKLDLELLAALEPELVRPGFFARLSLSGGRQRAYLLKHLEEHLLHGDSRAALVVSVDPLIIAAYTDELDCAAWLRFPRHYQPPRPLKPGEQVVTVNTYASRRNGVARDLSPGPGDLGQWGNFAPCIADLLCREPERCARRVWEISEAEWKRLEVLTRVPPSSFRDGRPSRCRVPAAAP